MAPRPDVSDERRHQIMDAALDVFSRLGFERASMEDIARQAGISKAALYLYYKSKDAIIAKLLQVFFDQAIKQLRAMATDEDPVATQLVEMTRQFIREMDRMVAIQPITLQFYAVAARLPQVRQHLRAYFAEYRTFMEGVIRRGIARGEFRAALDPAEVAITFTALFEGHALLWLVDPQGANWHEQIESATRLLLQALAVTPDAQPE